MPNPFYTYMQFYFKQLSSCNIMAEGFCFIYLAFGFNFGWEPFGSAHGLVRCKLEHRCWRACGENVSFTDVQIKIPKSRCDQGCEWRHAPEACVKDLVRFEKVSSWELDSEREGSTFGARWGQMNLCTTGAARNGVGGDGKVIIERLYISLLYAETFNSKVIKGSVPELWSRYVFRDSYFLCIYVMNILCTFPISISWVCYI